MFRRWLFPALSAMAVNMFAPSPKPAKKLTPADLQRLQAAEAKRQRRMEKRRNA